MKPNKWFWLVHSDSDILNSHHEMLLSQQTRDVGPVVTWCWVSVLDAVPTSSHHWANVSCLLGTILYKTYFARYHITCICTSGVTYGGIVYPCVHAVMVLDSLFSTCFRWPHRRFICHLRSSKQRSHRRGRRGELGREVKARGPMCGLWLHQIPQWKTVRRGQTHQEHSRMYL